MTSVHVLALLFAALVIAPPLIARVHGGTDRVLTRASIGLFGDSIDEFRTEHPSRQAALRAAHVSQTYREYGSKTFLYAGLVAVAGSIFSVYAIWGVLSLLSIPPSAMLERLPSTLAFLANLAVVPTLTPLELVVLLCCSSLTLGIATGGATYWLRWWYPAYVANERARRIEATLPSTVAFVYALSRSGMEFSKVTRIVADNGDTYGAAAEEFDVAVKNVDTFGMDVITAVQTMGRRTASDQFREFTENLVSVLQSGHSLADFLEYQYHDYQEEAESQQESTIELLSTLAEAYVTVLVAGPLFLITILVVIGFSLGDTLNPLQVLIYVILPFGNLAFVVYLSTITDSIDPGRTSDSKANASSDSGSGPGLGSDLESAQTATPGATPTPARRTDGGVHTDGHPNVERVRLYRRLRAVRNRLTDPIQTLVDRPESVLAITVPLALCVIVLDFLRTRSGDVTLESIATDLAAVDDTIALSALFVIATYAVVYELHRYRVDAIEAAVPDFLDRLASVNQAGMPIVTAIDHVRSSDLGPLGAELDHLWADLEWGADLASALRRFEARVRTRTTSRVVTLLTEAMNASGNLSTVLRIAARQASSERRLKRARKSAMLEYMVVVYVSFLVFLFIIVVLSAYLLPNLPTDSLEAASGTGNAMDSTGIGGVGDVDAEAYTQLFYHATLVQGLLSGFIAGQLSTTDVKSGAKHAAIMIAVTYLLFAFVV